MKGYKGFNSDWTCLNMKYKVGETYEMKGKPVLCEEGFHFCEYPLDVFKFYRPIDQDLHNSVKLDVKKYAKVESLGDVVKECYETSKCCTNKIKIESEMDYKDIIIDSIKCIEESIKSKNVTPQIKNSNECGKAISYNLYDYSKSVNTSSGSSISANIGDNSASFTYCTNTIAANTGDHSYSGNYMPAISRNSSNISANTGMYSISLTNDSCSISSTTGDFSVSYSSHGGRNISASTGNYSISHSEGFESISANVGREGISYTEKSSSISVTTGSNGISYNTGEEGIAIANGTHGIASVESKSNNSSVSISLGLFGMAKGNLGSWLVLADWDKDEHGKLYRSAVKSFLIDNVKVKENTLYTLENGELKEVM